MSAPLPSLAAVTVADVRRHLGDHATDRGLEYAREGRVSEVTFDYGMAALHARVRGDRPTPYTTVVVMRTQGNSLSGLEFGRCTCPMTYNCKHVAAVVLHAMRRDEPVRPFDHWSHTLTRAGTDPPSEQPEGESALALQLTLSNSADRPNHMRLLARPLRRSARGAWVTTGISWDRLPYLLHSAVSTQSEALNELYALSIVKGDRYYYQQSSSIDLSHISGRFLWDLLDQASAAGIEFVHARRALGIIAPASLVVFDVDITSSAQHDLTVTGRLRSGENLLDPRRLAFLGDEGSGLVHWQADADEDLSKRAFALGRLTDPVAPSMLALACSTAPLTVPATERGEFSSQYLPTIRRYAAVTSTDSSYSEPVITGPELELVVTYSSGHRVSVDGNWQYAVDDSTVAYSASLRAVDDGTRDLTAEAVIARAVNSVLGIPAEPGSVPEIGDVGMGAIALLTESVPALRLLDSVTVRVDGDPPEFSDVSDDLTISLSTKAVTGSTDWFDLQVDVTIDGTVVPLSDLIAAVARGETHLLLPDGRYFDLQTPRLAQLRSLISEARALSESPTGPLRLSRFQAGLWDELTALGVVKRQAKAWKAQVSGLLALESVAPVPSPSGLDATLRNYQVDGLSWLSFIFDNRLGGILADDMGLGKTVQTLALFQRARETSSSTMPFLIVAPTSVVHNWAREAERFTPDLTIVTLTATQGKRLRPLADLIDGADIVVTSYAIFRLDFDVFESLQWEGLVLDEAQNVKNHQGKTYQCARRLSTPFKLAITGTPMENNVMELWALLSITSPGLFPSPKAFTENYRRPIENDGDTDVLNRLRRRIRPLLMRRTKEFVASDLPPKQEQTVEVDLHPKHRKIYDTILSRERQKILGLLGDLDRNRFTILTSLTLLRQLSLDAALVDARYQATPSAKTDELVAQLIEIAAGGHRALVFSQFTRYLGRVRDRLREEGIEFEYLDGSTTGRGAVIERFRTGTAPVFLISLKAGGVGLTLTEADYCFVLDPWWNPATEAQAIDRAHRIGQKKTVFVNRYVARDTIEEKVMILKERKAKLFASVLDDGGAFSGSLSADDIRGLIE